MSGSTISRVIDQASEIVVNPAVEGESGVQAALEALEALIASLGAYPRVRAKTGAAQAIANATSTIANFGTVEFDTHSAFTTGAACKYTVPTGHGGKYLVCTNITMGATTAWLESEGMSVDLFINGVAGPSFGLVYAAGAASQLKPALGSTIVDLDEGDEIDIRVYQESGTGLNLYNSDRFNWIAVARLP